MDRFFVVVGRIISVLLLLVLLGGIVGVAFLTLGTSQRERSPALVAETVPGTKAPVRLNLGSPEQIIGVDATMIELRSEGSYSKIASGGSPGETRNLLFLTGADKKASWLFKNHQNLVLDVEQIQKVKSSSTHPALAVYVRYVPADTNGDGELSEQDNAVLALVKPDGTGFLPIAQGVSRVISYDMQDDDQLSLVYQRGMTLRHVGFSIKRFTIDFDKEILNMANGFQNR